jgi:hypothetical protein
VDPTRLLRELQLVLKQFEGTFVKVRYAHEPLREKGQAVYHRGDLVNMVFAVHDSIALGIG